VQRLALLGFGVGTAGRLAVDCDDVRVTVAQPADPANEAFGEQLGVQGVDQVIQCIVAGDAVLVRQEAAQEIHMGCAPVRDLDEVLGSDDGGAQDQQQDFRQWVDHLCALSRVFERREVVEQGRGVGRVIHGGLRIGTGHQESRFVLSENPPPSPNH
jgi:hypothetical protein